MSTVGKTCHTSARLLLFKVNSPRTFPHQTPGTPHLDTMEKDNQCLWEDDNPNTFLLPPCTDTTSTALPPKKKQRVMMGADDDGDNGDDEEGKGKQTGGGEEKKRAKLESLKKVQEEAQKIGLVFEKTSNSREIQYFKSHMPNERFRFLSNFASCPVKITPPDASGGEGGATQELEFGSSEAAYQALSKFDPKYWPKIAELSTITDVDVLIGRGLVFAPAVIKNIRTKFERGQNGFLWKILSYNKKSTPLATARRKARESLGIMEICVDGGKVISLQDQIDMWDEILAAKFAKGTEMRELLISRTGSLYLIEQGSMMSSLFWEGIARKNADGSFTVEGFNFMGKMLMRTREKIVEEQQLQLEQSLSDHTAPAAEGSLCSGQQPL